jgi:hypothetical protein
MTNKRKYLTAPLRPGLDDDIFQALEDYGDMTQADLVRQGVRIMLGITLHRVVEVIERPVPTPRVFLSRTISRSRQTQ